MSVTMPYIICMIIVHSAHVMLLAITYTTYYCYFPFSSSSWINVYYIYNDYICYIGILFYYITSFHFLISQPFQVISGLLLGISEHFYYDFYCSQYFICCFASCHFLFFPFLSPFWVFPACFMVFLV